MQSQLRYPGRASGKGRGGGTTARRRGRAFVVGPCSSSLTEVLGVVSGQDSGLGAHRLIAIPASRTRLGFRSCSQAFPSEWMGRCEVSASGCWARLRDGPFFPPLALLGVLACGFPHSTTGRVYKVDTSSPSNPVSGRRRPCDQYFVYYYLYRVPYCIGPT